MSRALISLLIRGHANEDIARSQFF